MFTKCFSCYKISNEFFFLSNSSKRTVDFGLGRGLSGAIEAKHRLGMAAANFAGKFSNVWLKFLKYYSHSHFILFKVDPAVDDDLKIQSKFNSIKLFLYKNLCREEIPWNRRAIIPQTVLISMPKFSISHIFKCYFSQILVLHWILSWFYPPLLIQSVPQHQYQLHLTSTLNWTDGKTHIY